MCTAGLQGTGYGEGPLTHKSAVRSVHAGYSTLLQLQPGEQAKYTPYAQQVHGVLYQLSKQDLQKLAKAEGGYKLVDIEVGLPCFKLAWQLRLHASQNACWQAALWRRQARHSAKQSSDPALWRTPVWVFAVAVRRSRRMTAGARQPRRLHRTHWRSCTQRWCPPSAT